MIITHCHLSGDLASLPQAPCPVRKMEKDECERECHNSLIVYEGRLEQTMQASREIAARTG